MSQNNLFGKLNVAGKELISNNFNWDSFKKGVLYAVLLSAIAIAPILYFYYNYSYRPFTGDCAVTVQYNIPKPKDMVVGEEFGVMACRILDGHVFQVQLENGCWIEARLTHATREEATPAVIEALKIATSPSVILRRRCGRYWVVDFNLTLEARRTTLLEWLREQNLTL